MLTALASAFVALSLAAFLPIHSTAADDSWLDGPRTNWNQAGMEIPQAPPMNPATDPRCLQSQRPPETDADRALVGKGWTLFSGYQAGWGITAVKGLSGYDGMCRPMGFQEFVFVDGALAGTISPVLMNSREDGVGQVQSIFGPDRLNASYRRYKTQDPLCCPSGSADVQFLIDRTGPSPLLVPAPPLAGPTVHTLSKADSGQTIGVAVGDQIVVRLGANPTSGYSWQLGAGLDQSVVSQVSQNYSRQPVAPGIFGAPGSDTWMIQAVAPGTTTITLNYVRPFDPGNIGQTFTVTVNVS